MVELFSISLYTILITYTGVGNLRLWAERRLLAMPNERSSHTTPTPTGGGIAIALMSLLGLVIFALLTHRFDASLGFLIAGGAFVAFISWLDDLYTMPIQVRLVVHSLSALCLICGAGYIHGVTLPLLASISLGWLGFVVTFLCTISLINAYNFMDGIDGIAGAQAVIAGLTWTWIGYCLAAPLVMALGAMVAASSLGFLGYNWPPARIFMGDVGSAFLGYSFAALVVLAAHDQPQLACIGLLVIWPFVFDTVFTLIRRWRQGENVFQAHRTHLYQRLVIAGHSHRTVTLLYGGLACVGALLGLGWFHAIPGSAMAIVIVLPVLAIALCLAVRYYEARPVKLRAVFQERVTT